MFTVCSTLIWAVLTGLTDWVCHIGILTLCIEAVAWSCIIVTWWSGSGGDSSLISTTNWFLSVLWRCWFGHLACINGPVPPIDTIWAMMIVWRTRGDYRTDRAVLEAIIAFSTMHTYYEQLLQVKQICLCLTGFTSLCLDAYVFLCSLVFHCMHVVLL